MPRTSLNRQIATIALPAIVANITTPVLGLVDVAITGHLGSAACIGAIAVGSTVFNMLYWLFNFLRMGTVGLTSQSIGAGDRSGADAHLCRSVLWGLAIGSMLILICSFIAPSLLNWLEADDATLPLAKIYVLTLIWGAPATLMLFALNGWQLGMQDSRLPMAVSIFINLLNITASASLVFGLGMGIKGVAFGTLTAQWAGVMLSAVLTWHHYKPKWVGWQRVLDSTATGRMVKINADIFLRTLCLVAVTVWFTRSGAAAGVDILAANAILLQLFMLFSYFCDGFGFAGEALAGKFFGAGDNIALSRLKHRLLVWGGLIAMVFSAAYFVGGDLFLKVLTDEQTVRAVASDYLPWAATVPLCGFSAFVFDGLAVGLTRTRAMLGSMSVAVAAFFCVYFLLSPRLGNHALWLAFITYLTLRGAGLGFLLRK